jgi:hypothetical protein
MMKRRPEVHRLFLTVAAIVLYGTGWGSRPAFAQLTAPQRLWNAKSLACTFTVVSMGNWKNGQPFATVAPAKLSFDFEDIDTDEGSARVNGPMGHSEIVAKLSNGTMHFMQSLDEGPLYLTTVFPHESAVGKLEAVHTRHEYTIVQLDGFTSRPEQYIGECTPKP